MPQNVRNFWLKCKVDGAVSTVETGPRSADGGFTLTIYMRSRGKVARVVEVTGSADGDLLTLLVDGHDPEYKDVSTGTITIQTER